MSSVGEEFPKEIARVREVLKQYQAIGIPGLFGVAMIEASLKRAEQATDVLDILSSYEDLKGIH